MYVFFSDALVPGRTQDLSGLDYIFMITTA